MARDDADLLTQAEARAEAKRLSAEGVPHIAVPVPAGSWGGTERGWTVVVLAVR